MKISVIIPVFNEENVIENTIGKLKAYLSKNYENYEIIAVNDGSSDRSGEILNGISGIKLITFKRNCGKGCAVKKGVEISDGDIVIFTDADLCYGTQYIKTIEKMLEKYDAAIGGRDAKRCGYGILRKIYSHAFDLVSAVFLGKKTDVQCGIKGFTKKCAKSIFPYVETNGFAFDFEILYIAKKTDKKVAVFPVTMKESRKSAVKAIKDPFFMMCDILKIAFRSHFKRLSPICIEEKFANEKTNI